MATKLAGSSSESSTIGSGGGEGIENDGGSAGSSVGCLFAGVPTGWGSLRVVPREDCNMISVCISTDHVTSIPEAPS